MNFYRASKLVDVHDNIQMEIMLQITGHGTPAYYRYFCVRWLAWYRIFYRLGDVTYRKKQIAYFIEDLQNIFK